MHYVEIELFGFGFEKASAQFFEYGVMNMIPLFIVRDNYFYTLCGKFVPEKCLFHHKFSTEQPDFFIASCFNNICGGSSNMDYGQLDVLLQLVSYLVHRISTKHYGFCTAVL